MFPPEVCPFPGKLTIVSKFRLTYIFYYKADHVPIVPTHEMAQVGACMFFFGLGSSQYG